MNKMWLVAKEVYRKNVKSWAFFWMIAGPILMGLVILAIGYFIYLDQSSSSVGNVGIVSNNSEINQLIEGIEDENEYKFDFDEKSAEEALFADEIDGYLVLDGQGTDIDAKFYRHNSGKNIATYSLQEVLSDYRIQKQAEAFNLKPEEVNQLKESSVDIETIRIQSGEDGDVTEVSEDDPVTAAKIAIAYIVCFVVFMFIMNYVSIVSQEIAAEKGSKIMEIILSSISATQHFMGKLIGVGLVILTQLGIYAILGVIFSYIFSLVMAQYVMNSPESMDSIQAGSEAMSSGFDPSLISGYIAEARPVILYGILFAVIGIFIYSIIAAFLGSLVSKTEDVNKMIAPITLLAVAGFYISIYAMQSPNSSIVRFGSYFPLFTPFVMPFRLANDTVAISEIWLSVGIAILFLALCIWLSITFYKSNVLVYSEKGLIGTFKQSLAIWKNEKE
ncbi:ABC transporter permease [Facklamia miroungae]|uniref:ABC-2 type transport system permease protein n=1 Tax=Facklamia miroungae TaxID=120956 RepID=A0A1G7QXI3_9LACT|nr:ABC transporter permease [Facklamia miroungae]NKZ29100.1 ABC transporter permease [Facklamia miroungae]SDG03183.1 ABC-2 type transport system permease protein [Facklamia miroungae]